MKRNCALIPVLFSTVLLTPAPTSQQADATGRLINKKLRSLSSTSGRESVDCGSTSMNKPESRVSLCAQNAFKDHKPFRVLYSGPDGFYESAYGLAGDDAGNVYEVEYDSRGLLHLGLRRNSAVFNDNHIRVTTCVRPIRLGSTDEGILGCVTPVNEVESARAVQQKVIEATACAILEHPGAFNNKMVRIHGYASGNFEYSNLGADGCSDELWFAYGNGDGTPGLVATVNGGARPGAEDAEGRLILPVPVKLVQDLGFRRFQELMKARAEADEQSFKENATTFTLHRVTATFIGRIDAVSDDIHAFHLKRKEMDNADFLGFGQMGLFDAQFVLQSVESGAVLEAFPPISIPGKQ